MRDACNGEANELKSFVLVNHWGTVIVKEPIEGAEQGVQMNSDDYNFLGEEMTIDEFTENSLYMEQQM